METREIMNTELPVHSKNKESVKLIEKALKNSVFLQEVVSDRRALRAIINAMELIKLSAKVWVSDAGKLGKEMYVCADGFLEMFDGQTGAYFKSIGPGEVFGEMAFICFMKRKMTVRTKTPCKLWVLHQASYIKIVRMYYTFEEQYYINFLKTIPVFRELRYESLLNILKLIRVECFAPMSDIIRQGEEGNNLYILTGGTALVHVISSDGKEKVLDQLGKGDFFGEGAILGNGIRNATVTAEAPGVECILLDKDYFTKFFADFEPIRKAAIERQEMMRKIFENDIEYHFVKIDDLEVKGTISNCSLGRIELVQHKSFSDLIFALKILKKAYVTQNDLQQNVLNEKDILMSCRSPFIVRLYKTFKDDKYLYFLQEAYLGGDLRHLLEQRNNFDDNMAKFISACVIEALDYLHGKNIVYGNLETKNLVFDSKGYIKLVDFGLARHISTNSDLIDIQSTGSGYDNSDPSTDYWLLGCIIYEVLVGMPPFTEGTEESDSLSSDYKNVNFPGHVTKQAKSVIKKMWKHKSGDEKNFTAEDFRQKKWYQNFSWIDLQNETMIAPYIPKIQNPVDLSNFAKAAKDKEIPPDCFVEWDKDF